MEANLKPRYSCIVLAAGKSERAGKNKLLLATDNAQLVLERAVQPFLDDLACEQVVVASKMSDLAVHADLLGQLENSHKLSFVMGGETRHQSTKNALASITSDKVLIHDGARPYISSALIDRVNLADISELECVIPVIFPSESIIKIDSSANVEYIDRESIFSVQTPQAFPTSTLKLCYDQPIDKTKTTDNASFFLQSILDSKVKTVDGDSDNLKITSGSEIKAVI